MSPGKKQDSKVTKDAGKKADASLSKGSRSKSIKPSNTLGSQVNQKLRKVGHKFCDWPGLYSMLITVLLGYS